MSYNKLSLDSFKKALKEGKYNGATGARRAIGKATTLSDTEKASAQKAINAHFGGSDAAAAAPKTASAKTAAPKKASAKKAPVTAQTASKKGTAGAPAAKPRQTATTPAKKKAAAKKGAGKKTRANAPTEGPADYSEEVQAHAGGASGFGEVARLINSSQDFEDVRSISTQVRLAERTIQNVGAALAVLKDVKREFPEADLIGHINDMGMTLTNAVSIFGDVVSNVVKVTRAQGEELSARSPTELPAPAPKAELNGVSQGEELFHASQPGAEAHPEAQAD